MTLDRRAIAAVAREIEVEVEADPDAEAEPEAQPEPEPGGDDHTETIPETPMEPR